MVIIASDGAIISTGGRLFDDQGGKVRNSIGVPYFLARFEKPRNMNERFKKVSKGEK